MYVKKSKAMWQVAGGVLLLSVTCNLSAGEKEGFPIIGVYGGTGGSIPEKSAECGVDVLYPSLTWWESPDWYSSIADQAHGNNIKM
jgi:hypothetical protein